MQYDQLPLPLSEHSMPETELAAELAQFQEFGKPTQCLEFTENDEKVPVFVNEFWTSKQRAASSLHEISYRACFKPQLPNFFISRLSSPGDIIYDPFMGRGTTLLEAAFLGRQPAGCDINPLSKILLEPRLNPPSLDEITERLEKIPLPTDIPNPDEDLLTFYHPETLSQITALKNYLLEKQEASTLDHIDRWIRMVATNRLTGHSPGFFSVYTLPPNQAVSAKSQRKINAKRKQTPPIRDVKKIILKKSKTLLNKISDEERHHLLNSHTPAEHLILTANSSHTPEINDNSITLVVTSPPFLDVVDYKTDNWLRCWFNGIDSTQIPIWQLKNADDWINAMTEVLIELHRILKPGGHIAFEVGEIRAGKIKMESLVIPAAKKAKLTPELILINDQKFTKTANCWGVSNQTKGTNTNRIILLRK